MCIKDDYIKELETSMLHHGIQLPTMREDIQSNHDFGWALWQMKNGHRVSRTGWNGKGMYLTLIPAGNAMWQGYSMQDCIGMKTANGLMQPGWQASQADMLAEDWQVVVL